MVDLLRGVAAADRVISWLEAAPECDQQIEIMELPRALGATLDNIPSRVPYITVDRSRLDRRRDALRNSGAPKIGLLWASSAWDPTRSIPLRELAPILRLPGYSFYSLQHGPEAAH